MTERTMICPDCGAGMSYRLGMFICPGCGREIEAPKPGKQEKRWSIRPEPWEQKQYKEQVQKAHHEPEEAYGAAGSHQPRATEVLGMYGDRKQRKRREYEGYGKLNWEKMIYFMFVIALHGFVIWAVATDRMTADSWFRHFHHGYFLFFLGWGGVIYLFFMWLTIFRQILLLKWLVIAALTVLIIHLLMSWLQVQVGVRYETLEALNYNIVFLEKGMDRIYMVALLINLYFVSILWRDVRRVHQYD